MPADVVSSLKISAKTKKKKKKGLRCSKAKAKCTRVLGAFFDRLH